MGVKITKNSRLNFADFVEVNGVQFWDLPVLPRMNPDKDDFLYSVEGGAGKRIDSVSREFLDDPRDWYVIAHINDMRLLPGDMKNGDIIRIPTKKRFIEGFIENS